MWDQAWRRKLVDNLEILVNQLWRVGVREIFAAGSFVELDRQKRPGDIDGYFSCNFSDFCTGKLESELNAIDPHGVWGWGQHKWYPDRDDPHKIKCLMWHVYRIELFPCWTPPPPMKTGILDENGKNQSYAEAFRKTRGFQPKGIIRIGGGP